MYLYETHLAVNDVSVSQSFYSEVVGLPFAFRDPKRDIVFLWIGDDRRSMLGLWGPGTEFGRVRGRCHLAIAVTVPELLIAGKRLNELGVATRNFTNEATTEPSV